MNISSGSFMNVLPRSHKSPTFFRQYAIRGLKYNGNIFLVRQYTYVYIVGKYIRFIFTSIKKGTNASL